MRFIIKTCQLMMLVCLSNCCDNRSFNHYGFNHYGFNNYGVFSLEMGKSGVYIDEPAENLKKIYKILIVRPDGTFLVKIDDDNYDKAKTGRWRVVKRDIRGVNFVIEFKVSDEEKVLAQVAGLYHPENNFNDNIVQHPLYVQSACDNLYPNRPHTTKKSCHEFKVGFDNIRK